MQPSTCMSRLLLFGSLVSLLGCASTASQREPISAQRAALSTPPPTERPRPNDASMDHAEAAERAAPATAVGTQAVTDPFLDATLAVAVRRELDHGIDLGAERVEVRVHDGVLTLAGAVPS